MTEQVVLTSLMFAVIFVLVLALRARDLPSELEVSIGFRGLAVSLFILVVSVIAMIWS